MFEMENSTEVILTVCNTDVLKDCLERIRILFNVLSEIISDDLYATAGCLEKLSLNRDNTALGSQQSSRFIRLKLWTEANNLQALHAAKDYLLAVAAGQPVLEKRCFFSLEVMRGLLEVRDEIEKQSQAQVHFSEDSVIISGGEDTVQTALHLLEHHAQDIEASIHPSKSKPKRTLESEDSSYDSDNENNEPGNVLPYSSHDNVSRTVSDTLAAEYAEYVTHMPPSSGLKLHDLSVILADPSYTSKVEFAVKLGYTETQVQIALQRLGLSPTQNELLAELIKLGATGKRATEGELSLPEELAEMLAGRLKVEDRGESSNLRPIVIDGSNVAMSHGNKEVFSCRGIQIAVDWFRGRGHAEITVFVPKWRKEASRVDTPIKDQEVLLQLEKEHLLVFTPSRNIGGKRIVCYEDRFVLRLAAETDGVVVSNDNYRDLVNENPKFKKVVEERLLMYSFVNDRFMPPDDPLGRNGPSLDNFLRKQPKGLEGLPPSCPYGKKCTYGNKCKYYHPERGNLPQKSVTERLAEQAKIQLQARGIKSRDPSPGELLKTKSLPPSDSNTTPQKGKRAVSRTKSHVPPSGRQELLGDRSEKADGSQSSWTGPLHHLVVTTTTSAPPCGWSTLASGLPKGAEFFLEPDGGGHLSVAKRLSDPDAVGGGHKGSPYSPVQNLPSCSSSAMGASQAEEVNRHRKLQRQLTLNPVYDPRLLQLCHPYGSHLLSPQGPSADLLSTPPGGEESFLGGHRPVTRTSSDTKKLRLPLEDHPAVTRIASAPDSARHLSHSRLQHLNSTSDTRLNLFAQQQFQPPYHGDPVQRPYHEHQAAGGVWQQEKGFPPQVPTVTITHPMNQPVRPSSVPPQTMQFGPIPSQQFSAEFVNDPRHKLYYHLCCIFPEEQVRAAMEMCPDETNPQKICAAILEMVSKGQMS